MVKQKKEERWGEWLIGAHTQNIGTLPLNCNSTIQDKTNSSKVLIYEGKGA